MAVQSSGRKWMFIGVGVIAAAALAVFFSGYPPRSSDSAGTIGSAQRYHSTQITGSDVKVDETAVTKWVQSETFDRIVKDPEARRLFANAAVQRLFTQDALHRGSATNTENLGRVGASGADNAQRLGMTASEYAGQINGGGDSTPGNRTPGGTLSSKVGAVSSENLGRVGASGADNAQRLGMTASEYAGRVGASGADNAQRLGMTASEYAGKIAAGGTENLAVRDALQNAAILDALHNQDFCKALANQDLLKALTEKAQQLDSTNNAQ